MSGIRGCRRWWGSGPRCCGWCWRRTPGLPALGGTAGVERGPGAAGEGGHPVAGLARASVRATLPGPARAQRGGADAGPENKGFETNLIADEMAKLGQVLHSFLKMAVSHQRLTRYLGNNPVSEVERDIAHCQRALKQEEDPRVQSSLRQALSLAQKRLRQHMEIRGRLEGPLGPDGHAGEVLRLPPSRTCWASAPTRSWPRSSTTW